MMTIKFKMLFLHLETYHHQVNQTYYNGDFSLMLKEITLVVKCECTQTHAHCFINSHSS